MAHLVIIQLQRPLHDSLAVLQGVLVGGRVLHQVLKVNVEGQKPSWRPEVLWWVLHKVPQLSFVMRAMAVDSALIALTGSAGSCVM